MNVLYFGDPAGALAVLDRGIDLVGVVHGRPGGRLRRSLVPRVRHLPRWHLPNLNDDAVFDALSATRPELIVAYFYPHRIPQRILDVCPGINVHPSALPRWRGPDPCTWTIREGDTQTEICVHWLAEGIDEGDVLDRYSVAVRPRENSGMLAARLEILAADRIAGVAHKIASGQALTGEVQSGKVTWAPILDADDWEIDWTQSAELVDRWVRAASPEPGAFTGIGEELLVIYGGRAVRAERFDSLEPGTPFIMGGRAHIRCGVGAYRIDRVCIGRRFLTGRQFTQLLI